jgi:Kef-type K+ transport system membrane component KefB
MLEFSFLLLLFIVLPHVLGTVFKINKFFPIFFVQLVLGVLVDNTHLFAAIPMAQNINSSIWSESFAHMGWFGIACVIALSSSEASEYHTQNGDRRFLLLSVAGFSLSFLFNYLGAWAASSMAPQLLGNTHNTQLFALSVGLSLSVTAVPVLVAIAQDLPITQLVRNTAISTALLDDLWLWLGIGFVLSLIPNRGQHPITMVLSLLIYLFVAWVVVKRLLVWWLAKQSLNSAQKLLLVIATILISSTTTEYIGLHSIFGVFVAGIILPTELLHEVKHRLLDVCNTVFVPLFFITSGMKIQLHGLGADFIGLLLIFTAIATLTKFCAVSLTSKVLGFAWVDSLVLGALMQCKGLMELVVANVLFEADLISNVMFAILSMYALISTVCTAPLVKGLMWANQRLTQKRLMAHNKST